jgi:hypothetical protein
LFTNPFGGAIAVVGPTGSTYRGEINDGTSRGNWWLADHFWELFRNGIIRPGENMYRTKWAYYLYMKNDLKFKKESEVLRVNMASYNLLGDPEVPIWPGEPKDMTVDVKRLYIDTTALEVTVKDSVNNSPIQGALVCIQGNDDTYERYRTDSEGKISEPLSLSKQVIYNITITRDTYIPYVDLLKVHPKPSDLKIVSNDDVTFEFQTDPPAVDMKGNISVWISNLEPSAPENSFLVNFTDRYTYRGISTKDYIGVEEVESIAANGKVNLKHPWVPKVPGEHVIEIILDPLNTVEETNETNNIFFVTQKVSGPDLRITSSDIEITPDQIASIGDRLTINVTVHNIDWGQVDIVIVSFFDGNPDDEKAVFLGNASHFGILNINEKITVSITTPPILSGGSHKFYAEVDRGNDIVESDELNNRASVSYDINHPPSFLDTGMIIAAEDEVEINVLDLLDPNIISDEDTSLGQLQINVINVSNPACGFSLREGRYVDLSPDANWSGNAVVNLSISDGVATIYVKLDVKINPVNDPPEIESIAHGASEIYQDEELVLRIKFNDIDNQDLKATITSTTGLFAGSSFLFYVTFGEESTSGELEWDGNGNLILKYTPTARKQRDHTINIIIDDGLLTDSANINIYLKGTGEEDTSTFLGMESQTAYVYIAAIIIVIIVVFVIIFAALRRKVAERPPEDDSRETIDRDEESE